jgi:hypothetical protein
MLKEIVDGLKAFGELAVKPLLAIAIASGFFLFAPALVLDPLGATKFVHDYRAWFGIAFVGSSTYLLAHLIVFVVGIVDARMMNRAIEDERRKWLETLLPGEKLRLREYIETRQVTAIWSIRDGVVKGLEAKGILYRASSVGAGFDFPFGLQPWAREILEGEPHLLED